MDAETKEIIVRHLKGIIKALENDIQQDKHFRDRVEPKIRLGLYTKKEEIKVQ